MKKLLFTLSCITILLFQFPSQLFSQALSGTYTIGSDTENFDFKSIGDALVSLELYGVEGTTVLELSDSYKANNELAQLRIGKVAGSSETNNIILTVADNVNEIVFTSDKAQIIEFHNAEHFSIIGKNKLVFQIAENINNGCAIRLYNNAEDGNLNVNIEGCTIIGENINHTGIYFTATENTIYNNSKYNINISNNTFYKVNQAIFAEDLQVNINSNSSFEIFNNIMGDNRVDYNISECAINLNNLKNVTITGNNILSIFSNKELVAGIKLHDCNYVQVNNNKILDIVSYNNEGRACGILATTANNITEIWCYNNMISHVAAKEASGISIDFTDQITNTAHIYYNSVLLTIDNSMEYFGATPSSCFSLNCNISTVLVKNNIFQNDFGDNPTSTEERFGTAISFIGENNPFSAITNNIFYTDNITNGYTAKNDLGYFDFDEWNDFNDFDETSLNTDPKFVSTYLLKINKANAAGTPIQQIPADYFGKHRNTETPDIGAHEANDNSGIKDITTIDVDAYYYQNSIYVNSTNELNGNLSLVSINGRVLFQTKISGNNIKIDLNKTINSGTYIVLYSEKGRVSSSKILIH